VPGGRDPPLRGQAPPGRRGSRRPAACCTSWLAEEPLRQLLDVLLDNALQHGAGTTTVAAEVTGPWARLTVEDEGPGVPAGHEESRFEARLPVAR
jgi:signal transduction histidine kinase